MVNLHLAGMMALIQMQERYTMGKPHEMIKDQQGYITHAGEKKKEIPEQ